MYRHSRKRKKYPIYIAGAILVLAVGFLSGEYLSARQAAVAPVPQAANPPITKPTTTLAVETQQTIEPHDKLADSLQEQLVQRNFSGTVLVYHDGHLILNKAYGWKNQEQQLQNQVSTQYCIGSVEKGQTAYLLMEAVKAGKVQLTDKLSQYYPQIKNSETITLRDMLNMSSGLKLNDKIKAEPTTDEKDILAHAILQAEVGEKVYSYQPINYVLLTGIIEQVTGKDYYDLFNQQITKSFQLSHTSFAQDHSEEQARSYQETNGTDTFTNESAASYASELGTGNVFMSAGDLFLYFHSLLSGEKLATQDRETLWENYPNEQYAAGIYNMSNHYHSRGVKANFETIVNYSKDGQNAIILLSNKHIENTSFNELGDQLFNQLVQADETTASNKLSTSASS
ncbi:serine hydrolase domain-containing protein [Enterococcus sp. AZ072]|uniref:serine hydrolase domain-containing protein n=1 Tax=unclassified Enterococcus TaxID=2608891 RepID=UPI003D29FCBC